MKWGEKDSIAARLSGKKKKVKPPTRAKHQRQLQRHETSRGDCRRSTTAAKSKHFYFGRSARVEGLSCGSLEDKFGDWVSWIAES